MLGIPTTLYQFLVASHDLRLPGLYADSDSSEASNGGEDGCHDMLSSFGMSRKKSHEVDRLSKTIAEVMTCSNLKQVETIYVLTYWSLVVEAVPM